MLKSERFWRFLRTSLRRRLTCGSNFDGTPYALSSMMRPGSWLVAGTARGAARAVPPAASAPPVSAALRRRKSLRSFFAIGPPPESSMRARCGSGNQRTFPEETCCTALHGNFQREPRGEYAGAQPDDTQAAEEARVLDLAAAVHDHLEPGVARDFRAFLADDAELQPEHLGADLGRLARDVGHLGRGAEDVDDIDRLVDLVDAAVDAPLEDVLSGLRRIDRDDVVAVGAEVNAGEGAR